LGILLACNWASDDAELDILCRFGCGSRFHAHSEEGAEEQNGGAPQLRVGEAFVKNPGGKGQRAGGTKELQSLRERDADFANRDVIQNVGERNAADRGNDENDVNVHASVKRSVDLSKGAHQGQEEY